MEYNSHKSHFEQERVGREEKKNSIISLKESELLLAYHNSHILWVKMTAIHILWFKIFPFNILYRQRITTEKE